METVIATPGFLSDAKAEGMTEAEQTALTLFVSANPEAGEMIVGSGGCRKLRFARSVKGKSGGYRVVTFYPGRLGVFLIAMLAKGSRANFNATEVNAMAVVAKRIKDAG